MLKTRHQKHHQRWFAVPSDHIFVDQLEAIVAGETAQVFIRDGRLMLLVTFDEDLSAEDSQYAADQMIDRAHVRGIELREGK